MDEPMHRAAGLNCPHCGQEQVRWHWRDGLEVYRLQCWACGWSMWEWSDHHGGFIYEARLPGTKKAEVVAHRPVS